jgi:adenosylhomocysteine nucleosidase
MARGALPLFCAVGLLVGCAPARARTSPVPSAPATVLPVGGPGAAASIVDTTPRVAVISAFEPELARLRSATTVTATQVINGRTHYIGTLAGQPVVLFLSGVSMVNAAMTTQAMLDRFRIRTIVFSGIAGGVNPALHIGDVTVPAQWGNYQEAAFGRATATGFDASPYAGEFPNFGMMFPRGTMIVPADGPPDRITRRFWFDVGVRELATARRIAESVKLSRCTTGGACLSSEPRIVIGGNGVSGPTFVDNAAYREWTWTTFKADALDMETAAVALVAHQNRVPYIAFRSLSDLAGGGPGANEAVTFGRLAADNSAAVVMAFLAALPLR